VGYVISEADPKEEVSSFSQPQILHIAICLFNLL